MDYSQQGNKRRRRRQNSQTTRVRNKVGLLFVRTILAVLIVAMFAGVGAGLGVWRGVLANAPEFPALDISPGEYASVVICSRTGDELARFHAGVNRTWVSIEQIPPHVYLAFIAIEDERFFEHNGIDVRSIGRAVWRLISSGGEVTEGASTITQQLIKNRLGRFDSDLTTKLQEQYLAVQFERDLYEAFEGDELAAKYFILEVYLNTINLGRTNHGVQAAAQFYYGVDVQYLTIAQAATIAAITQNPNRFPPDTRPENNWERAQLVLFKMHELGFITDAEYYEALNSDVYSTIVLNEAGEARATVSPFDCFTDALFAQLRGDIMEHYGVSSSEAERVIFTQGLRIYSTQDTRKQAIVDEVMLDDSLFPQGRQFEIDVTYIVSIRNNITGQIRNLQPSTTVANMEEAEAWIYQTQTELLGSNDEILAESRIFTPQPQAAFVLMDHHNGHVIAVRGVRGEKIMSRTHCRATIATRSPGSQLKPLVFGAAFDLGIMSPASTIEDAPWAIHPPGGQRYQPGNWWGRNYRGLQTARTAIHTSMNVLSVVALVDYVGIETGFAYMQNLGFSTLEGVTPAGRAWSDRIPALALGGLTEGVILLELAAAYATVANQGMYNRPIFYTHALDRDGNLFLENNQPPRQVLRRETAYLLTNTMLDTLRASGATGHPQNFIDSQMRRDIPIAGKTGTSQTNRDSGFVGYTPYFTGAVWMGFDMPRAMVSPGGYRATLWRTIMERVHEGLPPRTFERPPGIVSGQVCRDSGMALTELCRSDPRGNRAVSDIFAQGNVPTQPCHLHAQVSVCLVTGFIAGAQCHPYNVESRVGLMLPPLPDFAQGASIAGREFAFSTAVLEGEVCIYCDGFYYGDYDPDDPYYNNPYDPDYDDDDWLNILFPSPTPPGDYGDVPIPTPTPPPYNNQPPDDQYEDVPIPTPPADVPPDDDYNPVHEPEGEQQGEIY
ncbi:MAG: transglycosylase domain-containing protein [Defluviitaleaceae bacterium]|nr:transglycosylase domain-containing protein [Defluviitaleaceae bacterium]